MKAKKRTLLYDISSILYRVAAKQVAMSGDEPIDPQELIGLCMHISLQSSYKWFTKYKPDYVVFAFEGNNNWRKEYTAKHNIRRQYKANRVPDPSMKHYGSFVDSFRDLMMNHTSICCLMVPGTEADDAIAAYCQLHSGDEHEIFIVSGDRDFVQLLKLQNVNLVDPDTGKLRNQPDDKHYQEDIDYWLFLKCIRGDAGDNVPSAYPKVRETRIKEVFADPYKRVNFMNEQWVDEDKNLHTVGTLFKHNEVLMDLAKQPDDIRVKLLESVSEQSAKVNQYSHFHFLRFLGKFKLNKLAEEAHRFVAMFTNNQRYLKGELLLEDRKDDKPNISNTSDKPEPKSSLLQY